MYRGCTVFTQEHRQNISIQYCQRVAIVQRHCSEQCYTFTVNSKWYHAILYICIPLSLMKGVTCLRVFTFISSSVYLSVYLQPNNVHMCRCILSYSSSAAIGTPPKSSTGYNLARTSPDGGGPEECGGRVGIYMGPPGPAMLDKHRPHPLHSSLQDYAYTGNAHALYPPHAAWKKKFLQLIHELTDHSVSVY